MRIGPELSILLLCTLTLSGECERRNPPPPSKTGGKYVEVVISEIIPAAITNNGEESLVSRSLPYLEPDVQRPISRQTFGWGFAPKP